MRIGWMTILAAAIASTAMAQGPVPLQPGELLENGGGQQVKVLECRPVVYGRECRTVGWENGAAASSPAWWDEQMLLKGDARVRAALGKAPRRGVAPARTATATPRRPAAPPTAVPAAAPAPGTRIPDGTYRCQMWLGSSYVDVGTMRSVGGKLQGNPLSKAGATITGAVPTAAGITISYTTARGYRESMDCKRG